jgi:hypothetical protein
MEKKKYPSDDAQKKRIKVTLPKHIREAAIQLARAQRVSLSGFITKIITDVVTDQNYYMDLELRRLNMALIGMSAKRKMLKETK